MGPLRGDGNYKYRPYTSKYIFIMVEKMGPLRGDGNALVYLVYIMADSLVEKMGPLRGDGNCWLLRFPFFLSVEKMGPLRGDGN